MKKEIILLAILILASIIFVKPVKEWDEYVYILNAKHFAGENIYFEDIRPPLLPLILSTFFALNIEELLFIAPIIIFLLFIAAAYYYSKYFVKNNHLVIILLLTFPILLMYSQKFMTSILAATFMLLSLGMMKRYAGSKKNKFLYASFLFSSLAALTRYPLVLIHPVLIILFLIFTKKDYKALLISQAFFLIPIILWINYIGLESFYYAYLWGGGESELLFYFYSIIVIFGPAVILLPYLFSYEYKKEDYWLMLPLMTLLAFFQLFSNKQYRFFIPLLPFVSILIIKATETKNKQILLFSLASFLISLICVNYYFASFCDNTPSYSELSNISEIFENKSVISNLWPICAYYTNNMCFALLSFEELQERIEDLNTTHIIIFGDYTAGDFSEYNFTMNKLIKGSCENILVYSRGGLD